jgi:hypothetical protein
MTTAHYRCACNCDITRCPNRCWFDGPDGAKRFCHHPKLKKARGVRFAVEVKK